jgi:hypothetical protein
MGNRLRKSILAKDPDKIIYSITSEPPFGGVRSARGRSERRKRKNIPNFIVERTHAMKTVAQLTF